MSTNLAQLMTFTQQENSKIKNPQLGSKLVIDSRNR